VSEPSEPARHAGESAYLVTGRRRGAAERLRRAGVDSPEFDADELLAHVLGTSRARLVLVEEVTPAQAEAYDALVARRADREPLQLPRCQLGQRGPHGRGAAAHGHRGGGAGDVERGGDAGLAAEKLPNSKSAVTMRREMDFRRKKGIGESCMSCCHTFVVVKISYPEISRQTYVEPLGWPVPVAPFFGATRLGFFAPSTSNRLQ